MIEMELNPDNYEENRSVVPPGSLLKARDTINSVEMFDVAELSWSASGVVIGKPLLVLKVYTHKKEENVMIMSVLFEEKKYAFCIDDFEKYFEVVARAN